MNIHIPFRQYMFLDGLATASRCKWAVILLDTKSTYIQYIRYSGFHELVEIL